MADLEGGKAVVPVVLLIEDRPGYERVIGQVIQRAGLEVALRRVNSLRALQEAREGEVVIYAHAAPPLDVLTALTVVRKSPGFRPFVLLCDSHEEATALEALRRGAVDYVFWDRLARLGWAVRQALQTRRMRRDRQRTDAGARGEDPRLHAFTSVTPDVYYQLRVQPDDTLVNEWTSGAVVRVTEYPPGALTGGNTWQTLVHTEDAGILAEQIERVRAGRQDTRVFRIVTRTGRVRLVENTMQPLRQEGQGSACIVGMLRDVTEERRREQASVDSRREAEEANKLKSIFLTAMGHRLRAPLAKINTTAEQLERELVGSVQEDVRRIHHSSRRLVSMTSAVLEMAHIESGTFRYCPAPVDLLAAADPVLLAFHDLARERGLELGREAGGLETLRTEVDPYAFGRVLHHLLDNALHYTEKGRVTVSFRTESLHAVVTVRDTGSGIAPEFMDHLYEPFQRGAESERRHPDGNGLGLTIVRDFLPLMRATLDVESEPGVGSVFTLRLPLTVSAGDGQAGMPPEAVEETVRGGVAPKGGRVLVLEDNDTTRRLLELMLSRHYDVVATATADGALAAAREQSIDLFLLDINLGERRTGIDVMQALREMAAYARAPMVACTAYALPEDAGRFLDAGFDAFIGKPVKKPVLIETLERVREEAEEAEAQAHRPGRRLDLDLPPLPSTLPEIMKLVASAGQEPQPEQLTGVLERDPVLSFLVIKHANSAYYGLRQRVDSIERAVTLLGFDAVCNLVLLEVLRRAFPRFDEPQVQRVYDHLMRTSIATAAFARLLARRVGYGRAESAFTTGLLHNIGQLMLLGWYPPAYTSLWDEQPGSHGTPVLTAPSPGQELLKFGVNAVQVARQVAGQWELSEELAAALRYHLTPRQEMPRAQQTLTYLVAVARIAAEAMVREEAPATVFERDEAAARMLEEMAGLFNADPEALVAHVREEAAEVASFVRRVHDMQEA